MNEVTDKNVRFRVHSLSMVILAAELYSAGSVSTHLVSISTMCLNSPFVDKTGQDSVCDAT